MEQRVHETKSKHDVVIPCQHETLFHNRTAIFLMENHNRLEAEWIIHRSLAFHPPKNIFTATSDALPSVCPPLSIAFADLH